MSFRGSRFQVTLRSIALIGGLLALAAVIAAAQGPTPDPEDTRSVSVRTVADGFVAPVHMSQPGDGSDRLFVVDQPGQVRVVDDGELLDEPFLDVSEKLVDLEPEYDERGLLGLAFHPQYEDNGKFFVYYSAPLRDGAPSGWDHTSRVAEYRVAADDANRADVDSEQVLLEVDQPFENHNGGQVLFGNDDALYVSLGDGGNAGDIDPPGDDRGRPEQGNAQSPSNLLGSVLRLDVSDPGEYQVPDDNPFVDDENVRPEVWAYGLRNPYGLSLDQQTGDLYTTDAGQLRNEEVDLLRAGANYGWNIREGTECFNTQNFEEPLDECRDTGARGNALTSPVIEYQRSDETGSVVVPGVMYRGSEISSLSNRFVFGDYSRDRSQPDGIIYSAEVDPDDPQPKNPEALTIANRPNGELNAWMLGVMQDQSGRLYALTTEEGGPDQETGTGKLLALEQPATSDDDDGWNVWWIVAIIGAFLLLVLLAYALMIRRVKEETDIDSGAS